MLAQAFVLKRYQTRGICGWQGGRDGELEKERERGKREVKCWLWHRLCAPLTQEPISWEPASARLRCYRTSSPSPQGWLQLRGYDGTYTVYSRQAIGETQIPGRHAMDTDRKQRADLAGQSVKGRCVGLYRMPAMQAVVELNNTLWHNVSPPLLTPEPVTHIGTPSTQSVTHFLSHNISHISHRQTLS